MGQVLPFISKKEQDRIKRDLFLMSYLQDHMDDCEIVMMARMLPNGSNFEFTSRGSQPVTIHQSDLHMVTAELQRRNLTI